MGFSSVEVVRGRAVRPLTAVAASVRPVGAPGNRIPTVKVYIGEAILRAAQLRIGDRVDILVGTGDDVGKVRFAKSDNGDVRIRIETQQNVGFIASRLIPRGGVDNLDKQEVPHDVVDAGVLQITLPWLLDQKPEEEENPWT